MQRTYLPILPPTGSVFTQHGGELIIDPAAFPDWFLRGLAETWAGSVPVYDILVVEDALTRQRVILNQLGEEVCALAPPPDYDPWHLVDRYTELIEEGEDLSAYDASRFSFTFRLVLLEDWPRYQAEEALRTALAMPAEGHESPSQQESSSFRIIDVTRAEDTITGIFPGQVDCYYKLQTCSGLAQGDWLTVDMELGVAGEMSFTSEPEPARGYFRVRSLPIAQPEDEDGDGLDDVAELSLHDTDPLNADSDGDGLSDGWEFTHGHDAKNVDLIIDLSATGVRLEGKGLRGTCLFDPAEQPCFTSLDHLADEWNQVLGEAWPAFGSYHDPCDGSDPSWGISGANTPWPASRLPSPSPGTLQLDRLLYRYYPLQPTEPGAVYRITVLEMFESQSGGGETIHRIRPLLLSGDGTADQYFEPEDGFGPEQGARIDPPDQPGCINPHIIRLGFTDGTGGWTRELKIPNFPNGWSDAAFQVDPELFTIRLDCPEEVLPSVPQAFLSVQGAGSDIPDPPTPVELPDAGTDRHQSDPLAVVMDRIDDATPPSLLGIDDEELNDPTHYVQNLNNLVRATYTFPNADTISTVAIVPKEAETVPIHVYGMGFSQAEQGVVRQRIESDMLRARQVYHQMGLSLDIDFVAWVDLPASVGVGTELIVWDGADGFHQDARDCIDMVPTEVNVLYVNAKIRFINLQNMPGWTCIPSALGANDQEYGNNVFISGLNSVELTLSHELGHLLASKGEHESYSLSHALMKDGGTIWNNSPLDSKRLYDNQYDWVTKIRGNQDLVEVF